MDKLDIYTFGRQLITTRDLDPVYVVLFEAKLQKEELCKWLLAYWCFYHMGTACWITEAKTLPMYWRNMLVAAGTKDYPRGSERRHFRGEQATKAVTELTSKVPVSLVDYLAWGKDKNKPPILSEVMNRVKELRGFGEWIAFKVADMLERLGFASIKFERDDVFSMFEAPREGAKLLAEVEGKQLPTERDIYTWAYNQLYRKLGVLKAPPTYERRINIQEIETILCKWKSHMNGHYPPGKDVHEVQKALELFQGRSPLAVRLLKAGTASKLW